MSTIVMRSDSLALSEVEWIEASRIIFSVTLPKGEW
jgi:hypothetical protein